MRITRRLREAELGSDEVSFDKDHAPRRRLLARAVTGLALVASLAALAAATASCSSNGDEPGGGEETPTPPNTTSDAAPEAAADAGGPDASIVDAAPLPITCEAPPGATQLTTVYANDGESEGYCALLTDGTVACWGTNKSGQLGDPDNADGDSPVPVRVPGLTGITSIAHTCALNDAGEVWCWGSGPYAQSDTSAITTELAPVKLALPGPAKKVDFGFHVGCALLRDESLVCWGNNVSLQISGAADSFGAVLPPTTVIEMAAGAKEIAVSSATFAIFDDGRLVSWGESPTVGRQTSLSRDSWPTAVRLDHVTMIDTAGREACAVANGMGWCWGAADQKSSFQTVDPLSRAMPSALDTPEPITRVATTGSVSRYDHGIYTLEKRRWCATSVTGEVYCWGFNNAGQVGDGTKEYASRTVRVGGLPAPAAEVKVLPYSSCSLLTTGKVYCWGSNRNGQIGAGRPKGSILTPTEVILP